MTKLLNYIKYMLVGMCVSIKQILNMKYFRNITNYDFTSGQLASFL